MSTVTMGADLLQVCLVTGGARGVGLEFARSFINSSVDLVLRAAEFSKSITPEDVHNWPS